ncbi:DDE-type integrase/transposase/recombinase [Zobellia nedashkovskayae]|uniref:DDE-type integrase/transposase/recombinase n=1 Tax=Zobellia nedashkovskayae TaxID=2779510 RepID=UPI00188CD49A|nr:DDE-type integrase/transposase/recombinase [Zobellia nedashkovskayae]
MEIGYLQIIEDHAYVLKSLLTDNGMNAGTLNNAISKAKVNKTGFYDTHKKLGSKKIWIRYQSIPLKVLTKLKLPTEESEIIDLLKNAAPVHGSCDTALDFIFHQIWIHQKYWVEYMPLYKEYFTDIEVISNYARTHAIIQEIIICIRTGVRSLKEIHMAFQKLPKVCFKAKSYSYFSSKIKKFNIYGITENLVHDFTINGRKPYRVTSVVKSLIQAHRLNSKRYSKSKILILVNTHLKQLGHHKISQSTVDRICDDIEFRNKTDILRLGKKYADDNITPYLPRKTPDYAGGLYQIDSSQINIYYNNEGTPSYLTLCVVLDVYSRKIIGNSIGANENFQLISNAMKNAFVNGGIGPDNILVDNHKSYHSKDFTLLKNKLMGIGVNIRYAKVKNAKDKAHVERWFGTFQSKYLIDIYGFLGEGIKTKRENGRANNEKTKEYRKTKNLYEKEILIQIINNKITEYNEAIHSITQDSPYRAFKNSAKNSDRYINKYDIALIFGQTKKIRVRNSKIFITLLGSKHSYTILDRKISNKVNRTVVKVHYDEFDPTHVFMSGLNDEMIGVVYRDHKVNIVPVKSSEAKVYQSHSLRNIKNIKQNLKDIYKEIKEGYDELEETPVLGLDEKTNLKIKESSLDSIRDIENELLSLRVINKIPSNSAYDGDLKTISESIDDKVPFVLKRVR